jgi:hypothetical protein
VEKYAIGDASTQKDVIIIAILLLRYHAKNVVSQLIRNMEIVMITLESIGKKNSIIGRSWPVLQSTN